MYRISIEEYVVGDPEEYESIKSIAKDITRARANHHLQRLRDAFKIIELYYFK